MEARREFSVWLTAKSTTATVIVGGLLVLSSPELPHVPFHIDAHRPFIGLSSNFGIDGATAMHPETVTEASRVAASGAIGPDQRFKFSRSRFAGVSLPPDSTPA